jgi:hypothetical protein
MDGHKHETLSDETLEREIEAALGVDPSPGFLPRVRARIANERPQEGWFGSTSWRWASAGAIVAAVAIIGVWTLRDPVPEPREARITPPVDTTTPSIESERPAPGPVASPAKAPKVANAPRIVTVRATQHEEVAAPFEVVISPEESTALRRLFAAINNHRIETQALPDLQSALKPPDPIEDIVLEPITISPLAALQGE